MLCAVFKFTLVLISVLLFWRLFIFEFMLGVSNDTQQDATCKDPAQYIRELSVFSVCCCSKSSLLDALQMQMLSVGTVTYLEPKLFLVTSQVVLFRVLISPTVTH
jgi:hypothetical protein